MNQLTEARKGNITKEVELIADYEGLEAASIASEVAAGRIAVVRNNIHTQVRPLGVGKGLKTKVNANIGASIDCRSIDEELEKLQAAIDSGADAIMDLSTAGDITQIRKKILSHSTVVLGTVPLYQAMVEADSKYGSMQKMQADELFEIIEEHGRNGVDFITIHSGISLDTLEIVRRKKRTNCERLMGVVSRGGAFTFDWMETNGKNNPLNEQFDRLIEIAKRYDMVLSLGDGLRPGAIADATDDLQASELITLGSQAEYAKAEGVGVMIEGPGHVPLNQVAANIKMQKAICNDAPFYVLGPIVTDIAPGYDHITAAIGGAIAASEGADFLCYVTPGEHLRLPTVEDVKEGVIATRIAAHAGDLAKGVKGAMQWDNQMSASRKALDWKAQEKISIDPVKFKSLRNSVALKDDEVCSMCGSFCSIKIQNQSDNKKL